MVNLYKKMMYLIVFGFVFLFIFGNIVNLEADDNAQRYTKEGTTASPEVLAALRRKKLRSSLKDIEQSYEKTDVERGILYGSLGDGYLDDADDQGDKIDDDYGEECMESPDGLGGMSGADDGTGDYGDDGVPGLPCPGEEDTNPGDDPALPYDMGPAQGESVMDS